MKKTKRILALVLALTVLTSLFVFNVSAESVNWDTEYSNEFILYTNSKGENKLAFKKKGEDGAGFAFTAAESGLYRIRTGEPEGFLGKLFNLINPNQSDPRVEVSGDGGWKGYVDDNAVNGSKDVDGYIYMQKGETYGINFADYASSLNISFLFFDFTVPTPISFRLEVEFVGKIKSVSVNPETKTVYSVSKGEVSYDADKKEYTDVKTQIAVDVKLADGTTMTFDDYKTFSLYNVMDYYWKVLPEVKAGVNNGTIYCLDKELAFVFSVVR